MTRRLCLAVALALLFGCSGQSDSVPGESAAKQTAPEPISIEPGQATKPETPFTPKRISIDSVNGVTVIGFLEPKIVAEESVEATGDELCSLVEDEGRKKILLDLGNVQYISDAFVGKLIIVKRKLAAIKGQLKVCCMQPDLREVLRVTQLDRFFEIYSDKRSALASF
jgi:anti-sigma B factor antagonist